MRGKIGIISVLVVLGMLMSSGLVAAKPGGVPPAHADPTKIVPTDGAEPGHPFTIIDTGQARLTDGCKAVFKLGGSETVVDLRTHKPYNTAKGIVPDIGGGDYTVFVRQADGSEFEIGPFTVIAEPAEPQEPTITPTEGRRGDSFTIYDPQGRILSDSVVLFYKVGEDPGNDGVNADDIVISDDGTTLTGKVPQRAKDGDNRIWVAPSRAGHSYFDLPVFNVL